MFYGVEDKHMSGECPASRIWLTPSRSSVPLENIVHDQIKCIFFPERLIVMSLFNEAKRETESSPDTMTTAGIGITPGSICRQSLPELCHPNCIEMRTTQLPDCAKSRQ